MSAILALTMLAMPCIHYIGAIVQFDPIRGTIALLIAACAVAGGHRLLFSMWQSRMPGSWHLAGVFILPLILAAGEIVALERIWQYLHQHPSAQEAGFPFAAYMALLATLPINLACIATGLSLVLPAQIAASSLAEKIHAEGIHSIWHTLRMLAEQSYPPRSGLQLRSLRQEIRFYHGIAAQLARTTADARPIPEPAQGDLSPAERSAIDDARRKERLQRQRELQLAFDHLLALLDKNDLRRFIDLTRCWEQLPTDEFHREVAPSLPTASSFKEELLSRLYRHTAERVPSAFRDWGKATQMIAWFFLITAIFTSLAGLYHFMPSMDSISAFLDNLGQAQAAGKAILTP